MFVDGAVYRLVDTAGIRRARVVKAQKGTEYIMVKRAEKVRRLAIHLTTDCMYTPLYSCSLVK